MIGHDVLCQLEPELGELVEHHALLGHRRGKHHVEGGDTVGGVDDKLLVRDLVDLPDFAAADLFHG